MRRIELGAGDLLAPGNAACVRRKQSQRGEGQRKRRRIEDVRALSVLVPANQLFSSDAHRDHCELEIEPIRPEPKKEIYAENNRKRRKAQGVGLAARPG